MATQLSKTQVDRLGDRLRKGNITEADLRLLDRYRRSFTEAYEVVVEAIRKDLGLEPTGRPAKSTTSISDKLRRESIRLSQRAVHVIVNTHGKLIEIQVRTELQHLWAELSEKGSDIIDPAIKYGGGHEGVQELLTAASTVVVEAESLETELAGAPADLRERFSSIRQVLFNAFRDTIKDIEKLKGEGDDISD
jgi:putative GTP pyrophosphokinase